MIELYPMLHLDIVEIITKKQVVNFTWQRNTANLCELEDMPHIQATYLSQKIASWIVKNKDLLGIELTDKFYLVAEEKLIHVPFISIGYI